MRWTKEEDKVILDNYSKMQYKEIAELLPGRTELGVKQRALYGLSISKGHERTYSINMEFFKEPTIENSYWAGFIAADGCLTERKYLVSFGIQANDGYLLDQLAYSCGYNGPIAYSTLSGGYKKASLYLWGVEPWFKDLKKHFNITPRKSLTLEAPNLTEEDHIKAYIRGYIDGDGHIGKDRIGFIGTESVMEFIKEQFDNWVPSCSYRGLSNVFQGTGENVFRYKVAGKRAWFILDELLAVKTPSLHRKWNNYIQIKSGT